MRRAAVGQRCRTAASAFLGVCLIATAAQAQQHGLPESSLAVRTPSGWRTFWRASSAPQVWHDASLASAIRLRAGATGIEWGELDLAGSGEAWRTRLVVARVRPERVRISVDTAFTADRMPAWTIDRASDAVLAVNAGQFEVSMPWGWVSVNGTEWLAPGVGPLSAALVGERDGSVRWLRADEIAAYRASQAGGSIRWAFQSYPALLASDSVPRALREPGHDVDVAHRDARAAICIDHDERIVIALTRFNAMGSRLGFIPFGLTSPEMAGVMGALGCRDAMLLDGGISAQLMLRDATGATHSWHGVRDVPVGLVMRPR